MEMVMTKYVSTRCWDRLPGVGPAMLGREAARRPGPLAALGPELSCLLGSRFCGLEFGNLSYRASFVPLAGGSEAVGPWAVSSSTW